MKKSRTIRQVAVSSTGMASRPGSVAERISRRSVMPAFQAPPLTGGATPLPPPGGGPPKGGPMTPRLSIGDFSRMTYLSVKALRHYHEQGVLEPAEVDPATGYRYYAPGQ